MAGQMEPRDWLALSLYLLAGVGMLAASLAVLAGAGVGLYLLAGLVLP